jgi:uncharacterized repeat protein (TIGR04042 family)
MPETLFRVRWPDGAVEECYSPSTIVREHFTVGIDYPLAQFGDLARAALDAANGRVRARFGMGCAQAVNQIATIERRVAEFSAMPDATVRIEGFAP